MGKGKGKRKRKIKEQGEYGRGYSGFFGLSAHLPVTPRSMVK